MQAHFDKKLSTSSLNQIILNTQPKKNLIVKKLNAWSLRIQRLSTNRVVAKLI